MASGYERRGLGWLPDYPDTRDYRPESPEVAQVLKGANLGATGKKSLPSSVDLRPFCPPVEDQGALGSCTANAAAGAVEYFERRAFGKHIDGSRLFLYKTTRNLLQWSGDTGAFLRSAMGALVLFGVPPEQYWPYDVQRFEEEPPAFCYAFAANFKAIKYLRLDPLDAKPDDTLKLVKTYLAAGFPSIFGFTVYNSIYRAGADGMIPMPADGDKTIGGHAVLAIGYDNRKKFPGAESKGAFIIRNSWGPKWGEGGYGYLPYDYLLSGLADDWWTLIKSDWVDTNRFGQ